ncbi:MAG: c-type cytochrome, partial [Candidatus Sulfotelmatobacter sp.]
MLFALAAADLWAQTENQPVIRKTPAEPTSLSSGKEMYHAYCASCHGAGGKGDGPASPALKFPPSDLTNLAKRNAGKFPELRVFG